MLKFKSWPLVLVLGLLSFPLESVSGASTGEAESKALFDLIQVLLELPHFQSIYRDPTLKQYSEILWPIMASFSPKIAEFAVEGAPLLASGHFKTLTRLMEESYDIEIGTGGGSGSSTVQKRDDMSNKSLGLPKNPKTRFLAVYVLYPSRLLTSALINVIRFYHGWMRTPMEENNNPMMNAVRSNEQLVLRN